MGETDFNLLKTMEKLLIYYVYVKDANIVDALIKDKANFIKEEARKKRFKELNPSGEKIVRLIAKIRNGKIDYESDDRYKIYCDTMEQLADFNEITEGPGTGSSSHSFDDIGFTRTDLKKAGLIKENIDRIHRIVSYKIDSECIKNLNIMLDEIRKYLTELEKLTKSVEDVEDIDSIVNKYKEDFAIDDSNYDAKKVSNAKEKLIDYIKNIVNLDSDIFSLKERYKKLLIERTKLIETDCLLDFAKLDDNLNIERKKINDEIKQLNDSLNALIEKKPILKEKINIKLPPKPIFNMTKPEKPTLKTAILFNRKKVEEENQKLLHQYNEEMELYNKEYKKHKKDLDNYKIKVSKIKEDAHEQNKKLFQEELEKYNNDIKEYHSLLAKKEQEKKLFNKKNQTKLKETNSYKKLESIEYEKKFILENIKKDIELQNKLYSYNIIYNKYRNYIAMSSFIDYLSSGRCDTLESSAGAYNLYEQESRADIVINKMDIIVGSLDNIKENQYYIYNQLNNINKSLDIINDQLLVNNILQVVQITQLEDIIEKADKIAYNTKVTAYYANKAANYTKAITFMNLIDKL